LQQDPYLHTIGHGNCLPPEEPVFKNDNIKITTALSNLISSPKIDLTPFMFFQSQPPLKYDLSVSLR
jgi:hypothetical protein